MIPGNGDPRDEFLEVAVVGAGLAGCHVAARLARAMGGGRIGLFERGPRVGGRLYSVRLPDGDGPWADLGAMRIHTGLRRVLGLVGDLGLSGDLVPFDFGRPENLLHLRGTALRRRDLARTRVPYRMRPAERGLSPDALAAVAAETLVPGFSRGRRVHHEALARGEPLRAAHSLADFRTRCRSVLPRGPGGPRLEETTWADALGAVLSADAAAFVHDAGGYDVAGGGEGAAARLDLLFRTPPDAEYLCLRRGMESLPRALHERFTRAGGRTRTGHRLLRIDREGGGGCEGAGGRGAAERGYRLTFGREDRLGRALPGHVRVRADAVVLALPPGPLGDLEPTGLPFDGRSAADLETVEAVPAFKLFLLYPRPWWRDLGLTRGRSTTDTPLRQLWYGSTCQPPGTGSGQGPAPMLAAYPSGASVARWIRPASGPDAPARGPAGDRGWGPERDSAFPASRYAPAPCAAMVSRAHTLLQRVHGLHALPPPLAACWQDWSRDPHRGAWHTRRPGHDPRVLGRRMAQPAARERVHVVGDCWTHDPGSVEGTLDSAEAVLRDHFGLAAPHWYGDADTL
ncbi:FAD-dependent oxidoreductase [Nocardiopsis dassonvillei]|uniref:flavin monoamine oxidase family protein n=1 Tax=Nocardiopsis dassonvillei TaxID=2014 RepID=UPI0020A59C4B|nr:FAD-dependent oxidoreductase [Nocardiopsis dassonvillei]MCP3016962.1 FAD-dependent oxidoreductase [Nocardiopsis dassonvillei]